MHRRAMRRRKNTVRRVRRPGAHEYGGRQHGEEEGSSVIPRRIISSCTYADASGVNAARTEGHASRHVRPIGIRGATDKSEGEQDGKKSALHGILLRKRHWEILPVHLAE